eukprot:2713849-Amphidinium_carterae.1
MLQIGYQLFVDPGRPVARALKRIRRGSKTDSIDVKSLQCAHTLSTQASDAVETVVTWAMSSGLVQVHASAEDCKK